MVRRGGGGPSVRELDHLIATSDKGVRRYHRGLDGVVSRTARIGETKKRARTAQEHSGTQSASEQTMKALAEGNREYEKKFGHVYLVCATGRTADEMLANLRERMKNDPKSELRVAAEEQRKITALRLEKLVM